MTMNGVLKELMEQGKSFRLIEGGLDPYAPTVLELLDTHAAEPLSRYDPETGVRFSLCWKVQETTDLHLNDAYCAFIHRSLWKEKGQWEKGEPKTVWYKKPIPVKMSDRHCPNSGDKLLHTFKDGEDIWYVYETTVSTRPKYWLIL